MADFGGFGTGSNDAQLGGGSSGAGRDFIETTPSSLIATGDLESFDLEATGSKSGIKLKIWRLNGANYDFIGQSQVFAVVAGVNSITLDTPIAVQTGDLIGFFVPTGGSNGIGVSDNTGADITWDASGSDYTANTATSAWDSNIADFSISVALTGTATSSGTITLTEPTQRVFARAADGNGDITISGTYTGTPTNIEYRIVDDGTDTAVTGHDWQTLEAGPTGGTFSGTAADVPAGGGYNIDVRFSNDVAVIDNGTFAFAVGNLIGIIGQSNARDFCQTGTTVTATGFQYEWVGTTDIGETLDVWVASPANGVRALGNEINSTIPVGFIKFAVGSTGLNTNADSGSGYWLDTTAASVYDDFQAFVNTIGGVLDAIVWDQGENEAVHWAGVTAAQHKADLGTLRTNIASDISPASGRSSIPFIICQTGRDTRGSSSTFGDRYSEVRQGQREFASENADVYIVPKITLGLEADGIHHTAAAFADLGEWVGNAVNQAWSVAADFPGPTVVNWEEINATTIDVTISHGDGTDFTPTTAITGWEYEASSTWSAPSAAVRQSATVIRLTTSGTVTGVRCGYGVAPTITSWIEDNSTTGLPLLPHESISQAVQSSGGGIGVGLHCIESGII